MARRRDHDRYDDPPKTSGKAIVSLVLGIMAFGCSFLTGLPAIIMGILGLRDIGQDNSNLSGRGLAIGGIILGSVGSLVCIVGIIPLMIGLLLPAVQKVREAAAMQQSSNNVKQIALAMHAYHDHFGHFPPAALPTKDGKPGLSWRVALLPYLEQDGLYKQFKLDEPWDSANNKPLLQLMPRVYANPNSPSADPTLTHYQVFVGKGTPFEPGQRIRLTDITDGTSNTIMVVEAGNPVPWTKPDDIEFDITRPLPPLGLPGVSRFNVGFMDGWVQPVNKTVPPDALKASITRAGGEIVNRSGW